MELLSVVSRKLFVVLDANLDGEAGNTLKDVKDKNGMEVYRFRE